MMAALVAVMVAHLGGTPEEADKVWRKILPMPMPMFPSDFTNTIEATLKEVRS